MSERDLAAELDELKERQQRTEQAVVVLRDAVRELVEALRPESILPSKISMALDSVEGILSRGDFGSRH